jgi:hypothetical protein
MLQGRRFRGAGLLGLAKSLIQAVGRLKNRRAAGCGVRITGIFTVLPKPICLIRLSY